MWALWFIGIRAEFQRRRSTQRDPEDAFEVRDIAMPAERCTGRVLRHQGVRELCRLHIGPLSHAQTQWQQAFVEWLSRFQLVRIKVEASAKASLPCLSSARLSQLSFSAGGTESL